ncbi:MAG: hypothetical protein HYY26_07335 [Acidobacteria bacterium]|nr:hypothetical protein [Acidobacteriota bacterium]
MKAADACVHPPYEQFRRATRHGRGTGLLRTDCPRGQFWDPNGYCWSCPSGFRRTGHGVTDPRACARMVPPQAGRATLVRTLACPSGSFFDPIDAGTCWHCPQGYIRSAAHVKAPDACVTTLLAGAAAELGTCREGTVNIGGTCRKRGACGAQSQRPCLIGERTPSCNPGVREDFKTNRCVPLRPGETPFTAGLASLADFYSDGLRAACQQMAAGVRIESSTELAVGANCSKDILAGIACGFLVDQMGGGYASAVSAMLGSGATAVQFQAAVGRAYTGKCSRFAERLSRAHRGGRGAGLFGTDCPRGQFWDPNGYCYSCPKGFERTLNPVESNAACVDKLGGELLRASCSVQEAVGSMFVSPADCSIQMLQGGLIEGAQLDFARASQEVCMATGEFIYTFIDAVQYATAQPERSAEKIQSSLRALVSKVQRSPAYRRTVMGAKAASTALSGADLVRKLEQFPACSQALPRPRAGAPGTPAPPPRPPERADVITILNYMKEPVKVCGYRSGQHQPVKCFLVPPGESARWDRTGEEYPYDLTVLTPPPPGSRVFQGGWLCGIRDRREPRLGIHPSESGGAARCQIKPQ